MTKGPSRGSPGHCPWCLKGRVIPVMFFQSCVQTIVCHVRVHRELTREVSVCACAPRASNPHGRELAEWPFSVCK